MKTLVIIPGKNEARSIRRVVSAVRAQGWPVLVIDDGSTDLTASEATAAGATVLRHVINRGQGAALRTGIRYALKNGYDATVFFDADGQMEPAEIGMMVQKIEQGYEVVLGSRFAGKTIGISKMRTIVLKLGLLFMRLSTGLKLTDTHNGFQAWNRSALERLELCQDRQAYASEVLYEVSRLKLNYTEVPVTISYITTRPSQSLFTAFMIIWDLLVKRA